MPRRSILTTLTALALIVGASFFGFRWKGRHSPPLCQVCARAIPTQTSYRMETTHGMVHACCPRCAMHDMVDHPGMVRRAWATDFDSGRTIAAISAYYDEGGDAQYCTLHDASVERETEGVRERVYDRCLPTLVAFATRNGAEAYRQQHGGRILTYDQALESVRSQ